MNFNKSITNISNSSPIELFKKIKEELNKTNFMINGMEFSTEERKEIEEIINEFLKNNAINLDYPELVLVDLLIWLLENGVDLNILVGVFFLFQKVYKEVYNISEEIIEKINAKLNKLEEGIWIVRK